MTLEKLADRENRGINRAGIGGGGTNLSDRGTPINLGVGQSAGVQSVYGVKGKKTLQNGLDVDSGVG